MIADRSDAAATAYLDRLASPAWAWEFLRRHPDYCQQAAAHIAGLGRRAEIDGIEVREGEVLARRWGLLGFRGA